MPAEHELAVATHATHFPLRLSTLSLAQELMVAWSGDAVDPQYAQEYVSDPS